MESAASLAPVPDESKNNFTPEMQEKARKRQGIQLARKRILQQLEASGNERYTQMLKDSLADLDSELAKLES
ncbi:hypothetical protein [Candidatus Korobacter versatilis]|nr:hypothetical protein [Candidatus Koribacter versatilis]